MTGAIRQPAPADKTEIWGLLWGGASVPTEASGANPLAGQSPKAGATAAMTPGQSSRPSVAPSNGVSEAARAPGCPLGTFRPHTQWLRGVIVEMRRSGHGCADTFRRLCLVEDPGLKPLSFRVSAETADDIWDEIGGDIRGKPVTWECFRSAWRRAGNGGDSF